MKKPNLVEKLKILMKERKVRRREGGSGEDSHQSHLAAVAEWQLC